MNIDICEVVKPRLNFAGNLGLALRSYRFTFDFEKSILQMQDNIMKYRTKFKCIGYKIRHTPFERDCSLGTRKTERKI